MTAKVKRPPSLEAAHGAAFVGLHVEDGEEARDLQNVVNALGEMQQLEFAAGATHGGEPANQFADAGAIDVVDVGEIEDDFFLAAIGHLADGFAQGGAAFAERNFAAEVDNRHFADLPAGALESHGNLTDSFYSDWCLPFPECTCGSFLIITSWAPPSGPRSTLNSSMNARIRNNPRPEVRSRFSSASGSGISVSSKPWPWSMMRTVISSGASSTVIRIFFWRSCWLP